MGVRNKVAHIGGQDFNDDDTWRALDTMARLCEAFDDEAAEEIRKLLREARYGSAAGSTTVTETAASTERPKASQAGVLSHTLSGLPSWREVIEPHPDVAQGRYKMPNLLPIWRKWPVERVPLNTETLWSFCPHLCDRGHDRAAGTSPEASARQRWRACHSAEDRLRWR